MAIVTGDRYLEKLVKFVDSQAGPLIESTLVLKLNPVGLHYVQSRLESLQELERLLSGAPVDYLRAYVSDLGDYRALEQLRRILRLLTSLKVVSVLPPPARDPTPLSLLPFGRLRFLELRGCDLSTSAARGLLELRHTLEKLICHNSTDALRHIFASRIAEIKDSPQWSRLSFVSCPCNGLVLMDESLQLLPAVETLDLSRNKFSKVDNLWKCMKLKHLDLGFNNLRTIESCSKVKCHIVKLVLRNNALTTLRGIENLKSLEELDVSYNIISNFSELEILAGLPLLVSLWLEGNPICCALWYRPQVFSLFPYFHKLKLDDNAINTREYWKRQFIIARRQKQPASFGFYSPAKNDAEGEGNLHRKKKKQSRLASIESEEESILLCSDQDSLSCENEIQSKEDNVGPDDEAEIVDLINKVELMKKERSTLWLREFKEWMDQDPEGFLENGPLDIMKESYWRDKTCQRWCGESSRYVSDSVQASGDESSTNFVEYENSFADTSVPFHSHQYYGQISFAENNGLTSPTGAGRVDNNQEHPEFNMQKSFHGLSKLIRGSHWGKLTSEGQRMAENLNALLAQAAEDTMDTHLSSGYPESPPHYQEDILHRRHNLVEEILQLSAESYSVASTDSDTSCSEDGSREFEMSGRCVDLISNEASSNWNLDRQAPSNMYLDRNCNCNNKQLSPRFRETGLRCVDLSNGETSAVLESASQFFSKHTQGNDGNAEIAHPVNLDTEHIEKRRFKKKPIKRSIALVEGNDTDGKSSKLDKSGDMDAHKQGHQPEKQSRRKDDFIEEYFKTNIAGSRSNETCQQYLRCDCVLEQESIYREREVAVILSSTYRLYVLLVGIRFDGSGTILNMLGCHMVEDVREISLGMGLQVIRVCIDNGARYLFITRSIDKSRKLLGIMQIIDSLAAKCRLKSLEDVQAELFSKQICSGAILNIFQYSMVLFWCSNNEKSWVLRSLFVAGGQLLVCFEDIRQFSSLPKASSSRPYFSLVSCCSVADVIEMVIEGADNPCVTLYVENAASKFCPAAKAQDKAASLTDKSSSDAVTWKFKWFSENGLSQFVTLLRALHSMTSTPLFVRCVS